MRILQVICGIVFVVAALGLVFAMIGNVLYWQDLGDGVCDTCVYGPIDSRQDIIGAALISIAIYGLPMAISGWGFVLTGRAAKRKKV